MKIALLQFSVENFKIFKERASFSMFARKSEHTFAENGENILKTSLIFGPNASGKSSLLDAFAAFRYFIINSTSNSDNNNLMIPYQPFMLAHQESQPISFEAVISLDDKIFRYGFSFTQDKIISESLVEVTATGKEKEYFKRAEQKITVFLDFKASKDVAEEKTRKEALFLSAASQWNNDLAIKILDGFKSINVISGPDSDVYRAYTINLFKTDGERKNKILDFLKKADFCIEDGVVEKMALAETTRKQLPSSQNVKNVPSEIQTVLFSHNKFDAHGHRAGATKFDLEDESAGTQRFFDVLGPIVDTLENGKVLFIDEFDNSLHPFLTKFIIDLFEKANPKNAQLIVTTHDSSLLSHKELNKEQFWFTEKDKFGAAKIFSLAEFDIRNEIEFSKKYFEGRFGALPFINFDT